MSLDEKVVARLTQLVAESYDLARGDDTGATLDEMQLARCKGWLVSAANVISQVCESPADPYRKHIDTIADTEHGWTINQAVGQAGQILYNLLGDARAGLLASVANRARAEAFDDFLDHASAYLDQKRKQEAGAIAGVVFEDSVRRVCDKLKISQKGEKLENLISALSAKGTITPVKAKRARVAAHVRTKATHAQWDEFELSDVSATIEFTREFIAAHLD